MTTLSLRDLKLQAGQFHSETLELSPDPYRQGGIDYAPQEGTVAAKVDANAMHTGWATHLTFHTTLAGPCQRCLEPATVEIDVDTREVHDPAAQDEELVSDFIDADELLDVSAWAQEAIGVAFPWQVLCRIDCAGLCPVCGINRNEATCNCTTETTDSRWDALKALKLDD